MDIYFLSLAKKDGYSVLLFKMGVHLQKDLWAVGSLFHILMPAQSLGKV